MKTVYLRSDSAGYQEEILSYCAEGKNARFGVIKFAISSRVSSGFKAAVAELKESAWKPLYITLSNGDQMESEQQYAEVCFVPAWAVKNKQTPNYRYLAIREALREQSTLEGIEDIETKQPTHTIECTDKKYRLYGLVTNQEMKGDEVIAWYRERCGESEMIHSVQKNDLCGGQFPSNKFGANAAWWSIMVMTLNLVTLMKRLALPESLAKKRMKGLRFHVIGIAGHVVTHARGVILKLSGNSEATRNLLMIRRRLEQLAMPPPAIASG